MKAHRIQISEPWDFTHPNCSNTFSALGVAVIPGPGLENWAAEYYLLNVESPFEMAGELVSQLVCSPRYAGDSMAKVVGSGCTVGIARVKPGITLGGASVVEPSGVVYCAIGSISAT